MRPQVLTFPRLHFAMKQYRKGSNKNGILEQFSRTSTDYRRGHTCQRITSTRIVDEKWRPHFAYLGPTGLSFARGVLRDGLEGLILISLL